MASYIDWIVSFSIFLVYVLSLFLFLKPGVAQDYSKDLLMDLLNEQFRAETQVILEKYPLILKLDTSNKWRPGIDDSRTIELPIRASKSLGSYAVYNRSFKQKPAQFTGSILRFEASTEFLNPVDSADNKALFWIVYYPDHSYSDQTLPPAGCRSDWTCLSEDNFTIYELGVKEKVSGIVKEKVLSLFELGEEQIKEKFSFPESQGFNIYIIEQDTSSFMYNLDDVDQSLQLGIPRPEGVDIRVKEKKDWFINEDTSLDPVVLHLEVW